MQAELEQQYVEYVRSRLTRLRRSAYLLCGDWHRADDIVQATLTAVYLNWKHASRVGNLDGYVHRALVRRYLDERRLLWSRVRLGEIPEHAATVAGADDHVGERDELAAALQALPKGQRAAIVLRHIEGLSVEETAHALGCSTSNVKSQCSRGLASLRARLSEWDAVGSGGRA
ncbi:MULTISPECIES: SigE family RNA polymerase sigma factor [Catenuloplanes]|uniref:RNA polymerase sigma-70 factor (Sigma-E family) n=1 Tax=Catenuloplanes niger TaxID=587534 RepID=A0AAE4CV68_9ACTN|nr:SigE family RNA polymerase sigma factor [Catenuloplanes niger]MDR7325915.1 RNA polymerase sigma-70 factor (sigma-E family) [Catenuloplanes niger]